MNWVKTPIAGLLLNPFTKTLTVPELVAASTFPVFFYKNVVNVVQLWKASKILVGIDLSDRAKEREAREKDRPTSSTD